MNRKECIENLRFAGVFMMFLMTIAYILTCYFAATHDGIAKINMRGPERDIEVFIIFPMTIFLCIFTLSIEAYRFAEKKSLIGAIIIMAVAMAGMFLFMFHTILWGG